MSCILQIEDGGAHHKMAVADEAWKSNLDEEGRARYKQKVKLCGGLDPYTLKTKECDKEANFYPVCEYDIWNYLVLKTSHYSGDQMKAYKSMGAHNFFTSGHVHEPHTKTIKVAEEQEDPHTKTIKVVGRWRTIVISKVRQTPV